MIIATFNYAIADFLSNAKVLSMYRTGSAFNAGAESRVDDTKLDNQDDSFITRALKDGCAKLLDVWSGYTKDMYITDPTLLLGPYEYNVTYDTLENQIVFRMGMPDTFTPSTITSMDSAIRSALENYILYRTAKYRAVEFQSYQSDWEENLGSIREYLSRRTMSTRRNFNLY